MHIFKIHCAKNDKLSPSKMVIRYREIQYKFDACKLFDIWEIKMFQNELLEWYISINGTKMWPTKNMRLHIITRYKITFRCCFRWVYRPIRSGKYIPNLFCNATTHLSKSFEKTVLLKLHYLRLFNLCILTISIQNIRSRSLFVFL